MCDLTSKRVHSLNRMGAAVWDACADPASQPVILAAVQAKLGPSISEEAVWTTLESLQQANLVRLQEAETVSAPVIGQSRRSLVASLGSLAIPAVVTLTLAEQKAYAWKTKSKDDDGNRDDRSYEGPKDDKDPKDE
jgi:hypothetical protein